MKDTIQTLLVTFLGANLMLLATTSQAVSLSFTFSRLITRSYEGELFVASSLEVSGGQNIYAIDGFNNRLQMAIPFESRRNQTGNFYLVDGINNHFQISASDFPSLGNNRQLRWFKDISIDSTGNIDRTNKIAFSGANKVYIVDGINNQLSADDFIPANGTGNVHLIDGINNNLQIANFNNGAIPSSSNSEGQFRWLKTLSLDGMGNLYRSSEIVSKGTNNVYVLDGMNNQLQALNFKGNSRLNDTGNIYMVDGINNNLDLLPQNQSPVNLFGNWQSKPNSNVSGNNPANFEGINFFARIFGNQSEPDSNFLAFLANLANNSPPNNSDFPILPFLSLFTNIESNNPFDPSFIEVINKIFGGNNWIDEAGNFYHFDRTTSTIDATDIYFVDGINNQLQAVNSRDSNFYFVNGINPSLQVQQANRTVPEPSSVLGLACLTIGATVYRLRNYLGKL